VKTKITTTIATVFILIVSVSVARSQETTSPAATTQTSEAGRVSLSEQPTAQDASGNSALTARLITPVSELMGTPLAPIRSVRFQMQNVSSSDFLYASGWVVFFNAEGVRCGAGMWTMNVLAQNETIETDAPGLRLTCQPTAWRIEATNLIAPRVVVAPTAPIAP
jgi:hypothetical protein